MIKLMKLYFRMLRYRVAVMLLLFFLLGIAFHQQFIFISINWLYALFALSASYVAATTVNDLADKNIDAINHPSSKGRPLITGEATQEDMLRTHFLAVLIALGSSLLIGLGAFSLVAISIAINYIYSVTPFRFSYRTHLAPLLLAIAYVLLPYWLGLIVVKESLAANDAIFILAILVLFLGRIILKDFRDRKGDARYGKPTFLLKYGKFATCLLSFTFVAIGNLLLITALSFIPTFLVLLLEIYFVCIYYMGYTLIKTEDFDAEQVAIGIGAKMGNGLLITILGLLILREYYAPLQSQIMFTASLTSMYLINFILLIKKPKYALIGYRG